MPDNCEWIIIDGNSQDGTKEFLYKLPKKSNIKFLSELDNGIYDAMNKGILNSSGEYLAFMNSGDSYIRATFLEITKKQYDMSDIMMFDCKTVGTFGKEGHTRQFPYTIEEIKKWACVQHQSTFIRRTCFDILGLYSMEYKYLADYEYFVKAYLSKKVTFSLQPQYKLSLFSLGGVSTHPKTALVIANEYKTIQLNYFGEYNKILYISNCLKYLIGFMPGNKFIIYWLRKIILNKR